MSIEVGALVDVYMVLKDYIPSKDRQAAADHVYSILMDSQIDEKDLKVVAGLDSYLKNAASDYHEDDAELNMDDDEY